MRRPADAHSLKFASRPGCGGLPEHDVIELLGLSLVKLRHEVAIAVERGLNRGMTELRLDVLWVSVLGDW